MAMAQPPSVASHVTPGAVRAAEGILTRPVTIHLTRVSLEQAIDSVSRIAKVLIEFQAPVLEAYTTPVTLDVHQVPLGIVLERMLDGTTLRVVPGGWGNLYLVGTANVADSVPQVGAVGGRVVDSATGRGILGATVKIAGTKVSAVAGDSGRFMLKNVPAGDRLLTVRAFGYRPAERSVTVPDGMVFATRVGLAVAPNVLSGVVTTATGVEERRRVGSDITVINADSVLRVAPVTTVTQLLTNRVPGLVVQNTTGIPGAPARLRLRGESSLSMSDDPIVVIDGVRVYADQSGSTTAAGIVGAFLPGSATSSGGSSVAGNASGGPNSSYAGPSALDQLDVNSIETIEVLKGPSASALYGSDAANGVIVITTKRGRPGPTRWTLSMDQGWTTLPGEWPTNYYLFATPIGGGTSAILSSPYAGASLYRRDSLVKFQALNDPTSSPFGTGTQQNASVGVSGGNGALTYAMTGSIGGQTGYLQLPAVITRAFGTAHDFAAPHWMTEPDRYTTWGGNGQLAAQLPRQAGLTFSHTLFQSRQQQSSLQSAVGILSSTYFSPASINAAGFINSFYERAILETGTTTDALALSGWAPWSWLSVHATVGRNTSDQDDNSVIPYGYVQTTSDSVGAYHLSQGRNQMGTFDAGASVVQRFVTTALGLNVTTQATNALTYTQSGLAPGVLVPNVFTCTDVSGNCGTQSVVHSATYGWYVQPTLNLNSRFFVSPGFRLDGGSASGSSDEFNPFPRLDLSYIAVDRDHPRFGVLTLLRPRLAFGIAGVQPGPTQRLRLFTSDATIVPYDIEGAPGLTIPQLLVDGLGNTQLHPERSRELEGGMDAEFGDGRLALTLTGYHKMRYDAIMGIDVAPSVGVSSSNGVAVNVGTIRNTGYEATLQARLVNASAVRWSVGSNLSTDRNLVVALNPGVKQLLVENGVGGVGGGNVQALIVPGYPLNGFWARPIAAYTDVNGDGLIDPSEVRLADSAAYLGAPYPRYTLNLSTDVSLFNGRLAVSTAGSYVNGLTQYNGASNVLASIVSDPQSTLSQQASIAAGYLPNNGSAFGRVQTISTLRWTTLSITWIMPQSAAHFLRTSQLELGLQGSNLGLHSNYSGKDPDVSAYSTGNLIADTGQLPQPRTWSVRVMLR